MSDRWLNLLDGQVRSAGIETFTEGWGIERLFFCTNKNRLPLGQAVEHKLLVKGRAN